jgi:long-chain acyl-CoA synthetase
VNKFYPPERYEKPDSFRSLIKKSADKYGNKPLFKYIKKTGEVGEVSFIQFYNEVKSLGTAFFDLQLAGKRAAILSESRPEWVVAYMAAFCTGSVVVPLDKELLEDQIRNFIELSEADVLFYSEAYSNVVKSMSESLPGVKYYICFDDICSCEGEKFKSYKQVVAYGEKLLVEGSTAYARARIDTSKLSAIIFTSGTTGTSKGVMLSQDNLLSCIHSSANLVNFSDKDVLFSVLPLHHTYEMSCGILTPIMLGITVCFNNSLKYFMKNINIFKPTGMILVPLFVSTIYKKIMDEVAKKNKQKLFKGAVVVTKNLRKVGLDVRSIAFADVNKALGGNMKKIICGGAALEPSLVEKFEEFGINVAEGYGITECSPLVSVNPYKNRKHGSVGIPVKGSVVKVIVEDEDGNEIDAEPGDIGEICVKGPQVMLGYYKNPEATADAFNQEGFFKTGDYGYLDEDGYLFITGRKKNIIVLPNGKNVYPEEIEEYLYKLDVISECVVVGRECSNGEVVLTAIIYPDYSKFEGCEQNEIIERMKSEVLKINKQLPIFKQIRNIELKKNEFEKTSSKKIIRHKI